MDMQEEKLWNLLVVQVTPAHIGYYANLKITFLVVLIWKIFFLV
jgi:hypothetical protein